MMMGNIAYILQWSALLVVVAVVVAYSSSSVNVANGNSRWPKHTIWKAATVDSHILNQWQTSEGTELDYGQVAVKNIMQIIHTYQHPPKTECQSRRLLVLHTKTETLEGFGGVFKQIIMGLSAAIHSNRTLVWGLYQGQFLFDSTKEVWSSSARGQSVFFGATPISCPADSKNPLGGPFECFFNKLSACSLDDISQRELNDFVDRPFDDSARIKLFPIRLNGISSVAMFHAPRGMYEHIVDSYDDSETAEAMESVLRQQSAHLWAAAVTAYSFRLRPEIVSAFDTEIKLRSSDERNDSKVWGIHIRHGDVKSMHAYIQEKRVFSLSSFFNVAKDLSHTLQYSPSLLYVSTDSFVANSLPYLYHKFNGNLSAIPSSYQADIEEIEEEYDSESERIAAQYDHWYDQVPQLIAVNNSNRYRTEHGFVVAATDRCIDYQHNRKVCNIPMQFPVEVDKEVYNGQFEVSAIDRPKRMMRMLLEAVQDIYLLSMSDVIIGQASSHFSTTAIMLMWARTGAANVSTSVKFLDEDTMITGASACAYLQGTNLWNASYVGPGIERWRIHSHRFLSGLPGRIPGSIFNEHIYQSENFWSDEMLMGIVNGVPQLPEESF